MQVCDLLDTRMAINVRILQQCHGLHRLLRDTIFHAGSRWEPTTLSTPYLLALTQYAGAWPVFG